MREDQWPFVVVVVVFVFVVAWPLSGSVWDGNRPSKKLWIYSETQMSFSVIHRDGDDPVVVIGPFYGSTIIVGRFP